MLHCSSNLKSAISHLLWYCFVGSSSEHVKSSMFGGTLKSTFQTLKSMQLQGDVKQQGGQFVLGPGKNV